MSSEFLRYRLLTLVLLACTSLVYAQRPRSKAAYIPFERAQPILKESDDVPASMRDKPLPKLRQLWPEWVARQDSVIRARLRRGEEDSLANLVLFGTSFTKQPRMTKQFMGAMEQRGAAGDSNQAVAAVIEVFKHRVDDLTDALARPSNNERLQFMREVLARKGYTVSTAAGRDEARKYIMANLARVREEYKAYAEQLRAARQQGDTGFAERSTLFQTRGIALDSSLPPNFALEEALKAIAAKGLLKDVRRVAIVGPGLDFIDKQEGFDFYPPQSIQPFAIMDTLLRLKLAKLETLQVTTFDISERVNRHLAQARAAAERAKPYVVQLPRDPSWGWTPELGRYWEHFGEMIGSPAQPVAIPDELQPIQVRAVAVRPAVVARISPADLNIVYQRRDLPAAEQFDLIIGTNIFVYYGRFEQALALANIEHMLRPGGLLLSNDVLIELPSSQARSIDSTAVPYSDREGNGDRVVWYQRVTQQKPATAAAR